MSVVHRITGYDKKTEFIVQEFDVPNDRLAEVRDLARVDPRNEEVIGAYLLDRPTAILINERLDFGMWIDRCDWFFEPFAVQKMLPTPGRTIGNRQPICASISIRRRLRYGAVPSDKARPENTTSDP